MKHRLGFVFALCVGLFGQASALAQQPAPLPPPPPPPPGAPPSDKPAEAQPSDSVGGQTDPNAQPAPKAAEPTPSAPPAPPAPGTPTTTPDAPPPVTLPPYLTGGPQTILTPQPTTPQVTTVPSAPGPGADAGVVVAKKPAYVKWRGTNINWGTNATTTALGIGRDNISSTHEQVSTGLNMTLNYFILEPKLADGTSRGYSFRVQTALGFDVELTNSDITTTEREPLMRDLPLQGIFAKPLWASANKEWGLGLAVNGTVLLPTSKLSHDRGIYFTTSPRASLFLTMPLRGKKAPFLQSLLVGGSLRWDHQFSRATVPTEPDIAIPRRTIQGTTTISDQLTGGSLETNGLRLGGFVFFDEKLFGHTLWVFMGAGLQYGFVNQFNTSGCVKIDTGCVQPDRVDNPETTRYNASFSLGVSYFPSAEWGFDLGYSNGNSQLGLDGKRRNLFYSPDASFSASLILSLDAIYERFSGPGRDEPFIVFGQNKKSPTLPRSTDTLF